jgi:hypothetical protein
MKITSLWYLTHNPLFPIWFSLVASLLQVCADKNTGLWLLPYPPLVLWFLPRQSLICLSCSTLWGKNSIPTRTNSQSRLSSSTQPLLTAWKIYPQVWLANNTGPWLPLFSKLPGWKVKIKIRTMWLEQGLLHLPSTPLITAGTVLTTSSRAAVKGFCKR